MKKKDKSKVKILDISELETSAAVHARDINSIYKKQIEIQEKSFDDQLKKFDEAKELDEKEAALNRCEYWLKDLLCSLGQSIDLFVGYRNEREFAYEIEKQIRDIIDSFFYKEKLFRAKELAFGELIDAYEASVNECGCFSCEKEKGASQKKN